MYQKYKIQLCAALTGALLTSAGGVAYVATAGDTAKLTLYSDRNGTSLSNPVSLTNGELEFWTLDTVASVDIYGMTGDGQFFVATAIKASGPNEIYIDTNQRNQVAVIPFSIDDTTATTETDTGFDLPLNAVVDPTGVGVLVVTADATDDIDVGILSSESGGDADGFLDAVSVENTGMVLGTVGFAVGSNSVLVDLTGGDQEFTLGALLLGAGTKVALAEGTDVDTEANGFYLLEPFIGDGTAESISYTLSAGTDTAEGFIILPYTMVNTGA